MTYKVHSKNQQKMLITYITTTSFSIGLQEHARDRWDLLFQGPEWDANSKLYPKHLYNKHQSGPNFYCRFSILFFCFFIRIKIMLAKKMLANSLWVSSFFLLKMDPFFHKMNLKMQQWCNHELQWLWLILTESVPMELLFCVF